MNWKKISALAAIASKYNKAGDSPEEAERIAEYLLACCDEDPKINWTGTGGLMVVPHDDGEADLFLDLGPLRR